MTILCFLNGDSIGTFIRLNTADTLLLAGSVLSTAALAAAATASRALGGASEMAVQGERHGAVAQHVAAAQGVRLMFVEYEPQTRVEGEIQQVAADFPVHELWKVLLGEVPGRERPDQVTVFDSVGFALEDYTALRYIHQLAIERGVGRQIALVPELDDPKDLFGLTAAGRRRAVLRRAA